MGLELSKLKDINLRPHSSSNYVNIMLQEHISAQPYKPDCTTPLRRRACVVMRFSCSSPLALYCFCHVECCGLVLCSIACVVRFHYISSDRSLCRASSPGNPYTCRTNMPFQVSGRTKSGISCAFPSRTSCFCENAKPSASRVT